MRLSQKERQFVYEKFDGRCAYSGTILEDDWQADHITPIRRNGDGTCLNLESDNLKNIVPCQKLINHYKGSMNLDLFRTWYLGGLHKRLKKLPMHPKTDRGKNRKDYMLKIAGYFGITEEKPFAGKFYFETIQDEINTTLVWYKIGANDVLDTLNDVFNL